ncbi:hypothetical protein Tco_0348874 [Tanacetum coccineum]
MTPTQPSKQTPPLTTTLEPLELVFTRPPTSPHPYFDNLEDLPPRSTNTPTLPLFESIERLASQPPPLPDIMDVEPPLPPHFPSPNTFLPLDQSLWINGPPPPPIWHEHLSLYQKKCKRSCEASPLDKEIMDIVFTNSRVGDLGNGVGKDGASEFFVGSGGICSVSITED